MNPAAKLLTAALGGALLVYGLLQDRDAAPDEFWLGCGMGGFLILAAWFSW